MEDKIYWLWLTSKQGLSAVKMRKLLEVFGDIGSIYSAKSFDRLTFLSERDKSMLRNKDLSRAEKIISDTLKIGSGIIVYDDYLYPDILKQTPSPPYVLYVQGQLPDFDSVLTIGVVGTRRCSKYGTEVTNSICSALAASGVITIGGMASGIDTTGAWATIDAGGMAVGVLGNGLDIVYPSENAELVRVMTQKGCIISEYPPGTPGYRYNFPARNRIIAGLSRGLLVTEAPKHSGAFITAGYALENNRDVFAVPRSINETMYLGTNMLIQQGAKLVNSAEDILCEYPYAVKTETARKTDAVKKEKPRSAAENEKYKNLSESEKTITALLEREDMQIDEISRELGIPVSDINTKLIMLEVKGIVKRLPGSVYRLKI